MQTAGVRIEDDNFNKTAKMALKGAERSLRNLRPKASKQMTFSLHSSSHLTKCYFNPGDAPSSTWMRPSLQWSHVWLHLIINWGVFRNNLNLGHALRDGFGLTGGGAPGDYCEQRAEQSWLHLSDQLLRQVLNWRVTSERLHSTSR